MKIYSRWTGAPGCLSARVIGGNNWFIQQIYLAVIFILLIFGGNQVLAQDEGDHKSISKETASPFAYHVITSTYSFPDCIIGQSNLSKHQNNSRMPVFLQKHSRHEDTLAAAFDSTDERFLQNVEEILQDPVSTVDGIPEWEKEKWWLEEELAHLTGRFENLLMVLLKHKRAVDKRDPATDQIE